MKKILLAFVSAAFLFGCSADGSFNSSATPPAWDGGPEGTPSTGGGGGGGGGGGNNNKEYCLFFDFDEYEYICLLIGGHYLDTRSKCEDRYEGEVVPLQECRDRDAYTEGVDF